MQGKNKHHLRLNKDPVSVENLINREAVIFFFFLIGIFTKLQWKHLSVVKQMLDVTEMHLPKNVKTPRVLLPGMAEMMEHVEWNMFFVISQQKVNVSAPPRPPLQPPQPFTFVLRRLKRLKRHSSFWRKSANCGRRESRSWVLQNRRK